MSCIINEIPVGHENAVSREYLRAATGLSDRKMRIEIKESDELTINLQDGKGYFRPAENEDHLVRMYIRQEEARARNVLEGAKKAKRYLKAKKDMEDDRETGQMNMQDFLGY